MQRLDEAIMGLEQALTHLPAQQPWQHLVRQRLSGVDEALTAERAHPGAELLNARAGHLHRERMRLHARLTAIGGLISEASAVDPLRQELLRLLGDIQHHHQRVNDLAWDALAMDVGGSE